MSKADITGGVNPPFEPQKLDGSATKHDLLTPFDAHDQVLRAGGEYEHQEYPKVLASHDEEGNAIAEPVVAQNADHEAELTAEKE